MSWYAFLLYCSYLLCCKAFNTHFLVEKTPALRFTYWETTLYPNKLNAKPFIALKKDWFSNGAQSSVPPGVI